MGLGGLRVNCNPCAGSWSRCTVASWTKRIGSSQLSTMTHGPGPGLSLLYPALSSLSWHHPPGSLSRPRLCSLLQGQQSQAPAGATAEAAAAATTWASPRPRNLAPRHQPLSSSPVWGLLCFLRDSPLLKMHAIKWFSALVSDSLLQAHHPRPWPSLGTLPRPPGSGCSGGNSGARPPGRCVPFPLLRREGVCGEAGPPAASPPIAPAPPLPRGPVGAKEMIQLKNYKGSNMCLGSNSVPPKFIC